MQRLRRPGPCPNCKLQFWTSGSHRGSRVWNRALSGFSYHHSSDAPRKSPSATPIDLKKIFFCPLFVPEAKLTSSACRPAP